MIAVKFDMYPCNTVAGMRAKFQSDTIMALGMRLYAKTLKVSYLKWFTITVTWKWAR